MNVKEFLNSAADMNGYVVAALTDRYVVDFWPMQNDTLEGSEDKALEIHIFNRDEERRLFRSDISKDFCEVVISEGENDGGKYFDEYQYLDIDDTKVGGSVNGGFEVRSTGGGKYFVPLPRIKNACVHIRYYLGKYSQTGQSRIEKWRLVDFVEGK